MLYFDTQKLSTGPNRTTPDSTRWKCRLTRLLPKILAIRFVTNTRAQLRSLRRNLPGSISSAAILCNFSKLMSAIQPFDEFSLCRSMLFFLLVILFVQSQLQFWRVLPLLSSLCALTALRWSLPHFLLSVKVTPALLWEPFYFITARPAGEHMVYKNTTPLSPLPPKALPPSKTQTLSVDMVIAAAVIQTHYAPNNDPTLDHIRRQNWICGLKTNCDATLSTYICI